MPKRVKELFTLSFDQWNVIHMCVAFFPIVVIVVALILAKMYGL